jgi:hypothetical protein
MDESFYRISCWLHNRKGNGFAVELRETDDCFVGARQDEAGSPISSIRQDGKIDRSIPFRQFAVPSEVITSLIAHAQSLRVPLLPPITGGFDGANYHVKIQNGESLSHFSSWLRCPAKWASIQTFWEQVVELSRA